MDITDAPHHAWCAFHHLERDRPELVRHYAEHVDDPTTEKYFIEGMVARGHTEDFARLAWRTIADLGRAKVLHENSTTRRN